MMGLAWRVTPGLCDYTLLRHFPPTRAPPSRSDRAVVINPARAAEAPRAESALGALPGVIFIASIEPWEMAYTGRPGPA